MEILCHTHEMTRDLAEEIYKKLPILAGCGKTATVVCLSGELGSGKTTLVGFIAKKFGVKNPIISPTFVIMKNYKIRNSYFDKLVHIDAYRLESAGQLENLGWLDVVGNPRNIIFIEWPERVAGILPKNCVKINLKHLGGDSRQIKILWPKKKKTKK